MGRIGGREALRVIVSYEDADRNVYTEETSWTFSSVFELAAERGWRARANQRAPHEEGYEDIVRRSELLFEVGAAKRNRQEERIPIAVPAG